MKKPIIGISSNILGLEKGLFAGYKRAYVDVSYVNAVINAGGVPHLFRLYHDYRLVLFWRIQCALFV